MTFTLDKTNCLTALRAFALSLLLCSPSFAGLIVNDLESDTFEVSTSISAPIPDLPDAPSQPAVEQNSQTDSFSVTDASIGSSTAVSALIACTDTIVVGHDPLVGWLRDRNRCRSTTFPFSLLKPPRV